MPTVLLATDGSDLATAALAKGLSILGREHRFVTVAVVPPPFIPTAPMNPMEPVSTIEDVELEHEVEEEQRAESDAEVHELDLLLGITAEHLVETGEPGATICEVAERVGAEVIVVGSHGHGWLQRVLMGSVSTYVLHHAPCAVLVVRIDDPPEPADEG